MAIQTIATLKANMPVGTTGGTSVQDIHDIVDTFDSRTPVSVMEFGAVGNGTTDDTAAIQAAINTGRPVFFPPTANYYKVTGTLDLRAFDGQKVFGLNSTKTRIQMNTTVNIPIIHIGGRRKHLSGLELSYWPVPLSTHTDAIAIKLDNLMWSIIEDVNCYRVGVGIMLGRAGFTGTSNWCFSCTFRDIQIGYPTVYGIHIHTTNSTSTGNVFSNIYINGFMDDGTSKSSVQYGWYMEDHDSTVMDTCNIEHIKTTVQTFAAITVRGLVARALHMEGIEPLNWGNCVGSFSACKAIIEGWDIIHSTFLAANTPKCAVVQVTNTVAPNPNTEVVVYNLNERGNTIEAGANLTLVHSWDTFTTAGNASVRFINTSLAGITNIGTLTGTPARPVVRQVSDRFFYPTQAVLADLASGELYVDTTAANVIKRKA